jgi:hypothetical protein
MKVSRAAVATVAACLTVGLAGAPSSASAAAKDDSVKAKSAQSAKTVNRRLSSTRRSLSRTNRRLTTTRRQVATARRNISKITTDLGAVARRLQSAEGGVGLLLGAAPTLISSLQQLGTAVRDQIAPGLQALATAVQTQIAPGLQRVGDFISSPEYGAVAGRIQLPAAAGGTVNMTPALVSPDIPDSGNPAAMTAANFPVDLSALPAAAGNAAITIVGAIRSNENDGLGNPAQPAGQMGGALTVVCLAGACANAANAAVEPGELACAPVITPESEFALPNGETTDERLETILFKTALTDTDEPNEDSQNILGDGSCQVRGGGVYGLNINAQAVDIPTSTSPGPKD